MADWRFAKAETWTELVEAHDRFVENYNAQPRWAHREEELGRAFFSSRLVRTLDALGYARFRHWRLCGEAGWLKALRLEGYLPRAPRRPHSLQQALFAYADAH